MCEKMVNEEVVKLCLARFVEKLVVFFLIFECVYNPFGFYCVALFVFFRLVSFLFRFCFVSCFIFQNF